MLFSQRVKCKRVYEIGPCTRDPKNLSEGLNPKTNPSMSSAGGLQSTILSDTSLYEGSALRRPTCSVSARKESQIGERAMLDAIIKELKYQCMQLTPKLVFKYS